jgi:ribosomal protein L11 methyltransferase
MPAPYVEVTISNASPLVDELVALLAAEGFEGFWEDDALLKCYLPEHLWTPSLQERLNAILSSTAAGHDVQAPAYGVSRLAPRNWNADWEATITPIRVSSRIVIAPTWHPASLQPGEIGITIDPKMSFGTGYHETTRLMLRLMEGVVRTGDRVLDIGTGTGILAIASILLGADRAIGVDVDEWSYDNAPDNARLNDVAHRVAFRQGDLTAVPETDFTLIVANIQKNVLQGMLTEIRTRLAGDGTVLFSGLLDADREPFMESLRENGYDVVREIAEHEWIAFACRAKRP